MNGTVSGINSNIPNPGLNKYNPDTIPMNAINDFFTSVCLHQLVIFS